MGKFVIKDAVVTVNGVDLSDHSSAVTIDTTTDQIDVTGMTTTNYREFTPGFKDATF